MSLKKLIQSNPLKFVFFKFISFPDFCHLPTNLFSSSSLLMTINIETYYVHCSK